MFSTAAVNRQTASSSPSRRLITARLLTDTGHQESAGGCVLQPHH